MVSHSILYNMHMYTVIYVYKCSYAHMHSTVARLFLETDDRKRNWQALKV